MADRPPPPPPRPRGGNLPPVGARTPGLEELADDPPPGRGDGYDDEYGYDEGPNYLVRRAVVVGAVVIVVALAAVGVSRLFGGDDGGSSSGGPSDGWNRVVVLTADQILVYDGDGDEQAAYDADDDLLDAQSFTSGDALVTMTDEGRITITDLGDGTTARGRAGLDETLIQSSDDPTIGFVSPDPGGDVVVVDVDRRTTLSIGDLADLDDPLMFGTQVRVSPDGRHVATADARSFQSIVVDIEDESAELIAGLVVAIGEDRVLTAQRAGDEAELEFYDFDGERLGSVDVPTPVGGMFLDDGSVLVAGFDGVIRKVTADGDIDEVGALTGISGEAGSVEPNAAFATLNGDRLLVGADDGWYVVDTDGRQLGRASGDLTGGGARFARCVTVGSTRSTGTSVLLDLETGEVLTEIEGGIPSGSSFDGCTFGLVGSGDPRLVSDGTITTVDVSSIAAVAPNGSHFVALDGRDIELVSIDGEDVTELTNELSLVRFADV